MTHIRNLRFATLTVVLATVLYIQSNYDILVLLILFLTIILESKCIIYYLSRQKASQLKTAEREVYLTNHPSKIKSFFGFTSTFKKVNQTLVEINTNSKTVIELDDTQFQTLNTGVSISITSNNIKFEIVKL